MQNSLSGNARVNKAPFLAAFFTLLFIVAALCFYGSYVIIEAGTVGVILRLGAAKSEPIYEGFHFKIPFVDDVVKLDIRLRNTRADAASASKDLQTVVTQVAVQYSISDSMATQIYKKIGNTNSVADKIIQPAIMESVKAVTAQYTAEEIVTQRARVKGEIQSAISNYIDTTLDNKELKGAVNIANVAITDFKFSAEFDRAIEMKVRAEQEALQAKNEKIRRVTQAEASAAEKKLAAEADAYQIEVASKARADAIKREADALKDNKELIQLRLAEKWDGKLPYLSAGKDFMPLLNLPADKGN